MLPSDGKVTNLTVNFRYHVDDGATVGDQVTNDATVSMNYPGYGTGVGETPIEDLSGAPLAQPVTAHAIRTIEYTRPSPVLSSVFVGPAVVDGGGPLNAITPGWIMTQRQIDLWLTPGAEADLMKAQVLKEKVYPADIARMVLFLASDDSRLISAQNFVVDGGWT